MRECTLNWLNCDSHLNRYGLKGVCQPRKTVSVDTEVVKMEQARIKDHLAKFEPEDCWNVDESALFAFVPPDHVDSRRHQSGERASEGRITLCFACNSDGSQRRALFFIGTSKNPHSFGRQGLTARGFYYRSNKTAWMTKSLFEE